jgi:sarcosine oxidase, subunit gamma
MNALLLQVVQNRAQSGCKGPRAAEWLAAQGLAVPAAPNSYSAASDARDQVLIARLGWSEFFLEQGVPGETVRRVAAAAAATSPGVYPVLREDCAWSLSGTGAEAMLAEVCNINFAALQMSAYPVIMTLVIGVSVLIVPQDMAGMRQYRIWCDPTYGPSLGETLQGVVEECGGTYSGVTA